MSSAPAFLNCRVKRVDGSPVLGIYVRSFLLAQLSTVYYGYSDSEGQVCVWTQYDKMDQGKYWLCCSEGSTWRILFDILNHPFQGVSTDLRICENDDANANVTVTVAPNILALSNGTFEEIARSYGVTAVPTNPGSLSPHFLGR